MKLGGLGDAFHRRHFRQNDVEQTCFVQQFKTAPRAALGEDAIQLVPNSLSGNFLNLRCLFLDRPLRFLFDRKSEARREPDRTEHAKSVFREALLRLADCPNHACFKIGAASDVIQIALFDGIKQHAIDREISPLDVLPRTASEADTLGAGGRRDSRDHSETWPLPLSPHRRERE